MQVNFEEKTYESYFNTELDRQSEIYFPIGQVQEGNIGFDASAFSRNLALWRRLGHPFFYPHYNGVDLLDIAQDMENLFGVELDHIPKMKTNLIFQYKRPEYIKRRDAREWKHWNRTYYRYNIYKEQHDLLLHIHTNFGSKVFIVYASPAIQDINELVRVFTSRQIFDHSNFKKASDLNGHRRNTYIQAGTFSIACSELKKIDNFDLLAELKKLQKVISTKKTRATDSL